MKKLPPIEIPPQLRDYPGARFIPISKTDPGKKKPRERKWQTENNYPYGHPKLMGWLKGGGNYGIATGFEWLVCFDADEVERLKELGILDQLPPTFVVRTGGGGLHYYYKIVGMTKRIVLFDPELKDTDNPNEPLHLGEIQAKGQYVVGPGCLHKSGRRYEIINDVPVAELEHEKLLEIVKGLTTKAKEDRSPVKAPDKPTVKRASGSRSRFDDIPIERIGWPRGKIETYEGPHGTEYKGTHPFHSSRGGKNFSINPSTGEWHCFHAGHKSGGGPLLLQAVKKGIISCAEAGKGCLRGAKFLATVQSLVEDGLIDAEEAMEAPFADVELFSEDRITYLDSPLEHPPDDQISTYTGAPRTWKTYKSIGWMIEAGSAIFLSHTHAICEHAFRAFKRRGGTGGVHVQGKNRKGLCHKGHGNCRACELSQTEMGENYTRYLEFERRARRLLREKRNLDAIDIPTDMCPYQTLLKAAEKAPFIFAVPAMLKESTPHRELLIADEDTTLGGFFAPAVELFRYKLNASEDKKDKRKLDEARRQAVDILEMIQKKGRKSAADKMLQSRFAVLDDLSAIIGGMFLGTLKFDECNKRLEERLIDAAEIDYSDDDKEAVLQQLDEYMRERPIKVEMETDLTDYVACLLHLYKDWPLLLTKAGRNGYKTGTMVADQSKPCLNMKWIRERVEEGCQMVFIGSTLARIFAGALTNEPKFIEVKGFGYTGNYVVIPVDDDGEDNREGRAKSIQRQKERFLRKITGSPNSRERHPALVVVGSKQKQADLDSRLRGLCNCATIEDETGIEWFYNNGLLTVFYLNSIMSRGLDVPMFHLLVVHSCDFAIPYWTAATLAKKPGAAATRDAILMDEVTNAVLRMSPIFGQDESHPKIVIMSRDDLHKLKYLDGQVLEGKVDLADVATLLLNSNLTGTIYLSEDREERGTYAGTTLGGIDWEASVREGKLLQTVENELAVIKAVEKSEFDEEMLAEPKMEITALLATQSRRGKEMSGENLRSTLKLNKHITSMALHALSYEGAIHGERRGKATYWTIVDRNNDRDAEALRI